MRKFVGTVLLATLFVAVAAVPAATVVPPAPGATGACPKGFTIISLEAVEELFGSGSMQDRRAELVDARREFVKPTGVNDGFVCIKEGSPADINHRPIVNNDLRLD